VEEEGGASVGRSVMESTRCGNQIVWPAHDDAYAHDAADGDVTSEVVSDSAHEPDTALAPETAPSTRGALSTASPIGYRG
jgi:hypothetical protein